MLSSQLLCTLLLNSLWITIGGQWAGLLPGTFSVTAFLGTLVYRLSQAGIMTVTQILVLEVLFDRLDFVKRLQKLLRKQRG